MVTVLEASRTVAVTATEREYSWRVDGGLISRVVESRDTTSCYSADSEPPPATVTAYVKEGQSGSFIDTKSVS